MNIQILERTDCKGRQTVVALPYMCIGRTECNVKKNCKDRPEWLLLCVGGSSETQAVTRSVRHASNARREVEGEDQREFCVRHSE